jgi:hypothetical protein
VFFIVNGIDKNVFLYRLAAGAGTAVETRRPDAPALDITVSPNPFRSSATIRVPGIKADQLKVYDLRGRVVAELSAGNEAVWKPSGLSGGIYVVKATLGKRVISRPLLYRK